MLSQNFAPGRNNLTLDFHGRHRTAVIAIPHTAEPKDGYPLVLMLHGAGSSTRSIIEATGWEALGEKECFVSVFPNGTPKHEDEPENFLKNPQTWHSGLESTLAAGELSAYAKNIDDVGFLTELIATVQNCIPIDSNRIYVCGHSNGAGMAYRFVFERSSIIAAIGVMAGHFGQVTPGTIMSEPVPLIQILGDKDPFTPIEGGTAGIGRRKATVKPALDAPERWAQACGISAEPSEREETDTLIEYFWGKDDNKRQSIISIIVKGHGHDYLYPREHKLPKFLMGPYVNTLNATEVFWDFFKKHPKA